MGVKLQGNVKFQSPANRWTILLTILFWAFSCGPARPRDLSYQYRESLVRAAFLYNVSKFITWPASSFIDDDSPLVLSVLDPTIDSATLETIAGRSVRGRPLQVRTVSDVRNIGKTHILLIGKEFSGKIDSILSSLEGRPVLSVSGIEGFVEQGGTLEFFTRQGRLRFAVNLQTVRASGLILSSEVLRLASSVRGTPGGGL